MAVPVDKAREQRLATQIDDLPDLFGVKIANIERFGFRTNKNDFAV